MAFDIEPIPDKVIPLGYEFRTPGIKELELGDKLSALVVGVFGDFYDHYSVQHNVSVSFFEPDLHNADWRGWRKKSVPAYPFKNKRDFLHFVFGSFEEVHGRAYYLSPTFCHLHRDKFRTDREYLHCRSVMLMPKMEKIGGMLLYPTMNGEDIVKTPSVCLRRGGPYFSRKSIDEFISEAEKEDELTGWARNSSEIGFL